MVSISVPMLVGDDSGAALTGWTRLTVVALMLVVSAVHCCQGGSDHKDSMIMVVGSLLQLKRWKVSLVAFFSVLKLDSVKIWGLAFAPYAVVASKTLIPSVFRF